MSANQVSLPAEAASLNENTPLLRSSEHPDEQEPENNYFDVLGLRCLLIQHFSSAWGDRTAEFALYLYLIKHFEDTLLPSSIFGFAMTLTGILWSHWAGTLVDKYQRLRLVRSGIVVQKVSALCAYVACAIMLANDPPEEKNPLSSLRKIRRLYASLSPEILSARSANSFLTPLFLVVVLSGCTLNLSNICISIAVERDWATSIAQGSGESDGSDYESSQKLSKLNTYLRQIDLLCKLCAPIFVSFLTVKLDSGGSSSLSLSVLSLMSVLTWVFELYWIGVVYRRFPELQEQRQQRETEEETADISGVRSQSSTYPTISARLNSLRHHLIAEEWTELIRLPVFFSSLAMSLLYITVLSFDGIMVGYLKTLSFSDDLIAEMRGLCVITGLIGTALASPLENKIGTARAGNWSIWSIVISLAPVLFAFYVFAPQSSTSGHPAIGVLGAALIFGGVALSRIGLWSFDLIQTKQLQLALTSHPKRNALTALQYTMQNIATLFKFTITMIFWKPSQFRWAATTSFASVFTGALVYMVYVKNTRGHIMHLDWIKTIL